MLLRGIFRPKKDEVTRQWRRLHNEDLYDLISLPNVMRVVKSRRMRWAVNMAFMGNRRDAYSVSVGRPRGKKSL
jgi:hypothetical protein